MSKIGIVIDPHITDRHRCRQDDFLETVLGKLDYVASNNDYVLIGGDLFHSSHNPNYIFYRVYQLFTKHKGKFHAIPGNHDLLHNNWNALDKTTIGSLAVTGALSLHFSEFTISGCTFQPSHVIKDLEAVPVDSTNSKVLIGHNYLEMSLAPKESLTRDEIRALNYKLVFLGHDHSPYEEEYLGNSTLIRMGSLTRIDTQKYNKDRSIYYYQLDTETMEYEKLPVPCKPTSEIYSKEAFDRIGRKKEDVTFIQIGEVLKKFTKQVKGINSLDERLRKIATEEEIDYIKTLHEMNNVRYF